MEKEVSWVRKARGGGVRPPSWREEFLANCVERSSAFSVEEVAMDIVESSLMSAGMEDLFLLMTLL